MKTQIKEHLKVNRFIYLASIKYTFLLGMVAHAYAFFHLQVTHDSLGEFALYDDLFGTYRVFEWKIALGRFMNPVFRYLFQDEIIRPWVLGLFGLLCIALSVCLVGQLFSLKEKWVILLVSGVFVTNITVISCVATYMGDFAVNMLALFFSVLAAYLWRMQKDNFSLLNFLLGVLLVILSLGCYQSFLSVTIILILICSVLDLLNEKDFSQVFKNGLKGILLLGIGSLGYLVTVKAVCALTGIPLLQNGKNSLANLWGRDVQWRQELIQLYHQTVKDFLSPLHFLESEQFSVISKETLFPYFISLIHIVLVVFGLIIIGRWMFSFHKHRKEKALLLFLLLLIPLGANISHVLSGSSHDLMHYAFWLVYILIILLFCWAREHLNWKRSGVVQVGICLALGILIFYNIQIANTLYVKKELVQQSTLSTMTRVLTQIEEQDGYILGESQVAFIGMQGPVQSGMPGLWELDDITGSNTKSSITYQQTYQSYFKNMLQYPIRLCDEETLESLKQMDTVKEMPVFPNKGSVQTIEGIVVVKMSNDSNG